MNILFLTMVSGLRNVSASGIYTDLMWKFRDEGHEVYIIYPNERRTGLPTAVEVNNGVHCLGVRTLNVTKTSIIEKGVGQLLLEDLFMRAMNKYFSNVRYALEHNSEVKAEKIAPNSYDVPSLKDEEIKEQRVKETKNIREKYGLPTNVPIFIYG